MLHLVGETALAPEVDIAARPFRLDELEPPFDGNPDRLLVQVRPMMTMTSYGRTVVVGIDTSCGPQWSCGPRCPPSEGSDRTPQGQDQLGCEPVKASRSPRTNLSATTLHGGWDRNHQQRYGVVLTTTPSAAPADVMLVPSNVAAP